MTNATHAEMQRLVISVAENIVRRSDCYDDLLAALKALMAVSHDIRECDCSSCVVIRKAHAAIAKAEAKP